MGVVGEHTEPHRQALLIGGREALHQGRPRIVRATDIVGGDEPSGLGEIILQRRALEDVIADFLVEDLGREDRARGEIPIERGVVIARFVWYRMGVIGTVWWGERVDQN